MHYIILSIFLLLLLIIYAGLSGRKSKRHERNRKKAKQVTEKINTFEFEGQVLNYLRKIDAFVFEELLLNAFEKKGYEVIRNKRYTGDGGIDGKVIIKDQIYYIQAKRYTSHINKRHVIDFASIIERDNVKGLFIHTGKTGKASREEIYFNENIMLISGDKLIALIKDEKKLWMNGK